MFSSMNSHVSLKMLLPCELFGAVWTWAVEGGLPCVSSPVTEEVFLPSERLATVQAVVRSLGFYAHVELEVSVEMFPPAVGLGAALVGAVQQGRVGALSRGPARVVSVGVERVEDGHGDGTVCVSLVSGLLTVLGQTYRAPGAVEVPLVTDQVFLPLEIFTALRAPERSLGFLAEVSHLVMSGEPLLPGVGFRAAEHLAPVHRLVSVALGVTLEVLLPSEGLVTVLTLVHSLYLDPSPVHLQVLLRSVKCHNLAILLRVEFVFSERVS